MSAIVQFPSWCEILDRALDAPIHFDDGVQRTNNRKAQCHDLRDTSGQWLEKLAYWTEREANLLTRV